MTKIVCIEYVFNLPGTPFDQSQLTFDSFLARLQTWKSLNLSNEMLNLSYNTSLNITHFLAKSLKHSLSLSWCFVGVFLPSNRSPRNTFATSMGP